MKNKPLFAQSVSFDFEQVYDDLDGPQQATPPRLVMIADAIAWIPEWIDGGAPHGRSLRTVAALCALGRIAIPAAAEQENVTHEAIRKLVVDFKRHCNIRSQ